MATKFCTFAPNIYGPSVGNLLRVTLLAPRILWWLPNFWKTCGNVSCIFRNCFLPFLLTLCILCLTQTWSIWRNYQTVL